MLTYRESKNKTPAPEKCALKKKKTSEQVTTCKPHTRPHVKKQRNKTTL